MTCHRQITDSLSVFLCHIPLSNPFFCHKRPFFRTEESRSLFQDFQGIDLQASGQGLKNIGTFHRKHRNFPHESAALFKANTGIFYLLPPRTMTEGLLFPPKTPVPEG